MTQAAAAIPFARRMIATPRLLVRSLAAVRYADRAGAPGLAFAAFGRLLGLKALLHVQRGALDLLYLTPVNIVRYWEFPFALRHLAKAPGACLGHLVASPLLVLRRLASAANDGADAQSRPPRRRSHQEPRRRLGHHPLVVEPLPVSAIEDEHGQYDSIWSISVIEHIPDDGDAEAMRLMYEALAPGGTLIVTVPVDRRPWDEYRGNDAYSLGVGAGPQGTFFQRWYDEPAIARRFSAHSVPWMHSSNGSVNASRDGSRRTRRTGSSVGGNGSSTTHERSPTGTRPTTMERHARPGCLRHRRAEARATRTTGGPEGDLR